MYIELILLGVLCVIIMLITFSSIKIIKVGERAIIEKLGVYDRVIGEGLHFIVPFTERVAKKVDIYEVTTKQTTVSIVTSDDKELKLSYKINYLIKDIKFYHYGVSDIDSALHNIVLDVLRKEIPKIDYIDFGIELSNIENNITDTIKDDVKNWGVEIVKVVVEKQLK